MRDGVTVKVPISTGSHISKLVKAILIAEPFDLPARCLVSGTVQFNGKQCCIKCLQTGESCTAAKGGYIWVYPFNNENQNDHLEIMKVLSNLLQKLIMRISWYLVSNTQHGYMI